MVYERVIIETRSKDAIYFVVANAVDASRARSASFQTEKERSVI